MKNTFILKTSWCVIFLLLSVFIFGQKRYSLSFQIKQGITGIEKNMEDDQFSENIIPGGDLSIGIENDFYFFRKKYLSGSVGVLWNFNSFAKRTKRNTTIFNSTGTSSFYSQRTFRFNSHSIIFPISLNTQLKNIGFSFGIIPRYHLSTKLIDEYLLNSSGIPNEYEVQSITYKAGKYVSISPFNMGSGADVFLQTKMDVQFLVGVNLFLNDRLAFELEYKNIIDVNYLIIEVEPDFDVFTRPKWYDFNSKAITLGMSWRIF